MRYDLDLRHGEILTKILTSKTRTLSTPRKGGRPVREFVDASWTSRGQGEIGSGSPGLEILTKILTSKTRTLSTPRKGGRPVREFVDASWTSRGQGPCSDSCLRTDRDEWKRGVRNIVSF
jgi:hypothetical protein